MEPNPGEGVGRLALIAGAEQNDTGFTLSSLRSRFNFLIVRA
jgi:hypothetical protein